MDERGLLDLMIARLDYLSCREKITLCALMHMEQDIVRKSKADIEAIVGHPLDEWRDIDSVRRLAERDAAAARLRGIQWVSFQDSAYPPLLREIYDPPVLLFFKGTLPNPETPLVAIVGTRKMSPQAAVQAYDIAKGLAGGGISVVSGLALGIDAMAHRGNIEGMKMPGMKKPSGLQPSAPTFAVLGSGIDEVYPSSNRALARRVLETGGGLLSEYPPGTSPRKWNFPARNRIISGLSRGVLIVEAPQKSGALITARFALEQNRELWVASAGVSGNGGQRMQFDRRGTEKLAEDGAQIIHCASDILRAWNRETYDMADGVADHMADNIGGGIASELADSLGIKIEA